ncbi:MAG: nucleotidyltransferase family protein [Chloroflexi bacterium]|nr:nucleotidyltransferase family protein [Chloroflexota bacterium]
MRSAMAGLAQGLRPEAAVLLLGARSRLDARAAAQLRARLAGPLDWAYLQRIAQANGVTALLSWQLHAHGRDLSPPSVLADLRAQFLANAAHNLLSQRELLDVVQLLEGQGVATVPFKGPVLAAAAYANPSLRQYVDLDILVKRRDLRRALQLLHERGYRRALDLHGLGRVAYTQSECAIDLVSADGSIMVEVHWDLMPHYFSLPFDLTRLWGELETADLQGVTIRSLAVTDLLLFLCLHGAKHRWEQLRWLCDLAEIAASRPELDWARLVRLATEMGSARMLLLGLLLAAELLDAAIPPWVVKRAADDPILVDLAQTVVRQLFAETDELFAARNLFYLRAMESAWQRLRYCLHVALVPTKHELSTDPLPSGLSALYYPRHILHLLEQVGEEVVERSVQLAGRVAGRPRSTARSPRPRSSHAHH